MQTLRFAFLLCLSTLAYSDEGIDIIDLKIRPLATVYRYLQLGPPTTTHRQQEILTSLSRKLMALLIDLDGKSREQERLVTKGIYQLVVEAVEIFYQENLTPHRSQALSEITTYLRELGFRLNFSGIDHFPKTSPRDYKLFGVNREDATPPLIMSRFNHLKELLETDLSLDPQSLHKELMRLETAYFRIAMSWDLGAPGEFNRSARPVAIQSFQAWDPERQIDCKTLIFLLSRPGRN